MAPKIFRKDLLEVEVCADRRELGVRAGNAAAEAIRAAIRERGEARVIFAAAPSQSHLLSSVQFTPELPPFHTYSGECVSMTMTSISLKARPSR